MDPDQRPLGIYLNFPFCPNKCHFCSFGSRIFQQPVVSRYFEAVQKEIIHYGGNSSYRKRMVNTVYVGGGTPTLISEDLPLLIKTIKRHFQIDPSAEISLEAHPAGIRSERLIPLLHEGFNRISLGVQSFHDPDLEWMNRGHSVQEVYDAVHHVRQAGFKNLNLDLIYGFPGQTLSKWKKNLYSAVKLSPEHLSVYGLTLEEKTYLDYLKKQGRFEESDDELQAEMYQMALRVLRNEGFIQYEVSNFSKPGFESKHNLHYWTQGDFLGVGAHAASYYKGVHALNETSVEGYIRKVYENGTAVAESERLDLEGQFKEALVFGLRKSAGVRLSDLNSEYRPYFTLYLPRLAALSEEGFLKQDEDEYFSLTEKGLLFSDHISVTLS
jgi:oxygen-independent coproporphyrinogen-3 oxidase